ncbi:nucleotidyltransferase domain-containing protein [Anaerotruncus colihominis]|uniref:Nucleotidyltransferase domain-containing protein n=2 Tax=Anaerotruncus colihominis TaxID=169435 RepID=A0A845RJ96_9FIRM|nr:nucleotidyltransferase domain-containing protein [Anaerotruncus colihominis]
MSMEHAMKLWLEQFTAAVRQTFGARVEAIGIQGSHGRGEATEQSDIDIVVILDALSYRDLKVYDAAISKLPRRAMICGFLSGRDELARWDRAELFQFYHDTTVLYGSLDFLRPLITREDIQRAVLTGACTIYHACVHNVLHEKDPEILRSLLKAAVFTLQAKHFYETDTYIKRHADLAGVLEGDERALLTYARGAATGFDTASESLLTWSSGVVKAYGNQ